MKTILTILIFSLLFACATETQQKGLDEIANHYKASTSFSKGFQTIDSKTLSNFKVQLSDSEMLDSLKSGVTLSNVALILFKNLTVEERKKYDYFYIEHIKKNSDTIKYIFTPNSLNAGLIQSKLFTDFSDKLLAKEYKLAAKMLDPIYYQEESEDSFTNYVTNLTNKHGEIMDYKRTGFGTIEPNKGELMYSFNGFLTFADGYKRNYIIMTSQKTNGEFLLGYNLEGKS
ncbi:MAG TPA: hypothetical protein EYG92_04185 [Lutibacter sp.]|nr:hypothetical protein [Lutibacter sp.]